ncbi:UPF0161 protein At3g09310 [Silene latifolia]|uniref:UPF0161 protein At3g09310 n=1 Tax=Silene latifolia TaxID=37657 RepID=UPI003D77A10B
MATTLSSTWFLTPCSTIIYPSTISPCLLLKPLNHQKLYSRKSPNFSISFPSEHKFRKHGHIPVINNKIEADPDAQEEEDDVGVKAALSMLKFYKREISPLLPKSCRYVPTCSEYSMIAYKRYGVVKGTVLTAWRLCRCNPLGGSGFDPPRWFGEGRPPEDGDV